MGRVEYQRIYRARNRTKINLRNKQRRLLIKFNSNRDIIDVLIRQYLIKVDGTKD